MKLRDRTRKSDKLQLLTQTCIKPTNKLVSLFFEAPLVLGQATSNSGLTRLTTDRTRGKPSPSPIQYSLCLSAAPTPEWIFVPRLLRTNPEIAKVWTPTTLQDYNSLLKPWIRMRSKAKLQISSRDFQRCVPIHLHTSGSGQFPTFSGWESNCQFDSRPFFQP